MLNDIALLSARLGLAGVFVMTGLEKFLDVAMTADYIAAAGLPFATPLTIVAGVFELGVAAAVLIGWRTRPAALALAIFCVFTALVFHTDLENPVQALMFAKNFSMAGGFLALFVAGPGAFAVDARRRPNKP